MIAARIKNKVLVMLPGLVAGITSVTICRTDGNTLVLNHHKDGGSRFSSRGCIRLARVVIRPTYHHRTLRRFAKPDFSFIAFQ